MNILVYGAGVVGSQYAARLRQAGHMVTLLARGQRAADLRQHGIVIEAVNTGKSEVIHVMVKESIAPDDAYDLVIVAVRKNQLSEVLPALAANQHTSDILFLGNNPAGPGELVQALGRERVLLGFGALGGYRQGHIIKTFARPGPQFARTFLGELDGKDSPRLNSLIIALTEARLGPVRVLDMDAWLKTHAALISPLALGIYSAGGDNFRLARTSDGLVLTVRAIREGLEVLRALQIPVEPPLYKIFGWLPEPVLFMYLRSLMNTQAAQVAVAAHANAARDEMRAVADDFYCLVRASGRRTTAIDQLRTYLEPESSVLPEGSAALPLDMRAVWVGMAAVFMLAVLPLLARRQK